MLSVAQCVLVFLGSQGPDSLLSSSESSIWCSCIFLRSQGILWSCLPQGPGADVLRALLSFLGPGPDILSSWSFLADLSSPVHPFGSSCLLATTLVPGAVNFYGHCGEQPFADCSLFILFVAIKQS